MKKLLLLTLLTLFSFTAFGQTSIDFFDFIESFNWLMPEAEFKVKFASQIEPVKDASQISTEYPVNTYFLNGIKIGDYNSLTEITYVGGVPFILARLTDDAMRSSLPIILTANLDSIVEERMKEPDLKKDNTPIESLSGRIGNLRTWNTETITLSTMTVTTSEEFIYLFKVTRGGAQGPHFRKGRWGDSMAMCKKKEGKRDEFHMKDMYSFCTYVANMEAIAVYRFTDNKLSSGKYVFIKENEFNCIEDYNNVVWYLKKKYGEPVKVVKEDNTKESDKELYSDGRLVRNGKMKMTAYWFTPSTWITLALYGEEQVVMMQLEYSSNEFEKMQQTRILNDL